MVALRAEPGNLTLGERNGAVSSTSDRQLEGVLTERRRLEDAS